MCISISKNRSLTRHVGNNYTNKQYRRFEWTNLNFEVNNNLAEEKRGSQFILLIQNVVIVIYINNTIYIMLYHITCCHLVDNVAFE